MIECVAWGDFEENTYVAGDAGTCVVIDPGAPWSVIAPLVAGRRVAAILLTHTHLDHIFGADEARDATGAPLYAPEGEKDGLENPAVNLSAAFGAVMKRRPAELVARGGTVVEAGTLRLVARDVPGHSPGGLAWVAPGFVVTGDALFAGSIGRTDLPGSCYDTLISSLRRELLTLPDETVAYPGHGPATTIGTERRYNPFLAR